MAKPFLSVIIPAYNEADRLPLTLIDVDRHLSGAEYSYEIFVVDDGSTDNTSELTRKFMAVVKNLKLLNNPEHRGKGAAVKIGMLSAHGNWRLAMDADNSVTVAEFNNMMQYFSLDQGFEVITASRYVKGARLRPQLPMLRRLIERLLNFYPHIPQGEN